MKRTVLLVAAFVLLTFYAFGIWQWIQSGHRFEDVWQAILSDWLLLIIVLDLTLFALLCMVWLYRDMQERKISGTNTFLILLATLFTGMVTVLLYLAFRTKPKS